MGLLSKTLGPLNAILPILGAAQASKQKQQLTKKLRKELNKKPPALEIPNAYKQLLEQLNADIGQLGNSRRVQIQQEFGKNLNKALAMLKQRGLGSSNLTANLMQGSQKKQTEAMNAFEESLLSQKIGLNQGVGLAGLGASGGERQQQIGIRGSLLGQIAAPTLVPGSDPLGGLLQGLSQLAVMG